VKIESIVPARAAKKPRDVTIGELRLELREARRQIRALKADIKAEQAHATGMLKSMQHMSGIMTSMMARELDNCRCTPSRAESLRR
jgi:hypothetical protein